MRAVQIPAPGAPFELVERPIPEPGPREVRMMSGKARFRAVLAP